MDGSYNPYARAEDCHNPTPVQIRTGRQARFTMAGSQSCQGNAVVAVVVGDNVYIAKLYIATYMIGLRRDH